jgi:hypothetical protein
MSHASTPDHPTPRSEDRSQSNRREFLGKATAMAVTAVAAPTLLAGCDSAGPTEASAAPRAQAAGPFAAISTTQPWYAVHKKMQQTIGQAHGVSVGELEPSKANYVQRVVTDDARVGTGLATILNRQHAFATSTGTVYVYVQVQDSYGRAHAPRTIYKQSDLFYATREGLSTNPLFEGVLKESLNAGAPIVPLISNAVVQYYDDERGDYYGNYLAVASRTFVELFNRSVGGITLTATTRDLSRS